MMFVCFFVGYLFVELLFFDLIFEQVEECCWLNLFGQIEVGCVGVELGGVFGVFVLGVIVVF